MKRLALLMAAAAALAACGEKPQALVSNKADSAAYNGTGVNSFTAAGWKAGDKTSWEQHLRARQQNSQNDYSRIN